MDFPHFRFFVLGLTRSHPPTDRKSAKQRHRRLNEPQGSKNCRRNIIVLSATVTLAGLAGADPHTLSMFGVKPSGEWGLAVLFAAAVGAQVYWYVQGYNHLWEDGFTERSQGIDQPPRKTPANAGFDLARREADLLTNWVAFLLTVLSWWFIASWIFDLFSSASLTSAQIGQRMTRFFPGA